MGNIPLSCCRSKSPKLQQLAKNINNDSPSTSNQDRLAKECGNRRKYSKKNPVYSDKNELDRPLSVLQHISEREPDDSETDPSSNPYDKPLFASRSYSSPRSDGKIRLSVTSHTSSSNEQPVHLPSLNSNRLINSINDDGYSSTLNCNLNNPLYASNNSNDKTEDQVSNDIRSCSVENNLNCNEKTISRKKVVDNLLRNMPKQEKSVAYSHQPKSIHKSSSCSTIFIDNSTISQSNLDLTIKCVSLAIYYHIKKRLSDKGIQIFDETVFPLSNPKSDEFSESEEEITDSTDPNDIPSYKTILKYVKTLFTSAVLTSEYAITTLVYLERLMTYVQVDLTPRTWRRMFLGAILLSSKVWEDQAVWNVDYAKIFNGISVGEINELERQFLELIQFNMNVPSSIYAKYYFHLRSLAFKHRLAKSRKLLTVRKAKQLEAMSRVDIIDRQTSPVQRKNGNNGMKKYVSLEKLRLVGRTRAVLM